MRIEAAAGAADVTVRWRPFSVHTIMLEQNNSSATSNDMQQRYAAQTDVARQAGIFGSPTFMAGDEMFWGDDRLEEALDWCKHLPADTAPVA